jgi:CheY-like chemotaxis protein
MIFLDCHMPEMSGIEAASKIKLMRREMQRPCPPLIALTADVFPKMRRRCEEAGMIAFATKPFDFEQLRRLATRFAPEKFENAALPSPTPPPETDDASPASPRSAEDGEMPETETLPAFDWHQLLKIALGKQEFALELAGDMIETASSVFAKLNEDLHRGDHRQADRQAHNLKGMAFSCGAPRLGEVAQRLRRAIAERKSSRIERERQAALRAFQDYIDAFDQKRTATVPPSEKCP